MTKHETLALLNRRWPKTSAKVWECEGYRITEVSPGCYAALHIASDRRLGTSDHWSKARGVCQVHALRY